MDYILKLKEIDELLDVDKDEMIINREESTIKSIKIEEDEERIYFEVEEEKAYDEGLERVEIYKKINNVFREIRLNKKTKKIENIQEIISQWKKVKNKILYTPSTSFNIIENVTSMSNYFENEKLLTKVLSNYGIMSYFSNLNLEEKEKNNEEKQLEIYGLLAYDSIIYDVKYHVEKQVNEIEVSFVGNGESKSNEFSLVTAIHGIMELPPENQYFVSTKISGKYLFSDRIESMNIEIKFLVDRMKNLKKYRYGEKTINLILEKDFSDDQ